MAAPPSFQNQQQHKPIEEIMGNLAVEPSQQPKHSNAVSSKDGSPSDATSCISSAGDATSSVRESDVDHDSLPIDQGLAYPAGGYYGYYYPGYDGRFQGLDGQAYYVAGDGQIYYSDGTELQYPVVQADNGSLIYFMPGIHPAYNPYAAYLPVTMVGVDGQYASQPQFSASPVFQPSIASPGYMPTPLPYGEFMPSPYLWDPSMFAGDGTYGNGYTGMLEIPGSKPHMSSASRTRTAPSKKLPSDFSNSVDLMSSHLTSDTSGYGARNQSKAGTKPSQNVSAFHSDVMGKGYYPAPKFTSYNQGKGSTLHTNSTVKSNVGAWSSNEKPKNRSKTNSISDIGLTNEQTYDPRTGTKGSLTFGVDAADSLVTDGKGNINSHTSVARRDQYNLPDFPTKYDHALFFVIKSYSEDDIHKCIKYNVWASTPNGNKRLDTAYHDAQEKTASAGSICPVFLFFSVNASGQFCGVAEMTGPVDFGKSMDFWQQDKWNGFFPVKWHIIKDVPNPQLRHIILENNENKPVTNSRDTQEVRFPQGIDMLKIFKNYVSKTSILDDFDFYESRQKVMQEKRPKPLFPKLDPKQPKADELIVGFHSVDTSAGKNMVESEVGEKATG